MIKSQYDKLKSHASEYLSIGITSGGVPRNTIGVPWESTAHAFNMRTPNIYLSPEDIQDEEIMRQLETYKVIGCYIWASLSDYSFLTRFKDLQDINIKKGDTIANLDFLSELFECRMLYLQNANLKNLDVIVGVKKNSTAMFGCLRCIGLDNCVVEDLSVFETDKVHFSEFLIWKPEGSNERTRWSIVSAGIRRYFEFKEN